MQAGSVRGPPSWRHPDRHPAGMARPASPPAGLPDATRRPSGPPGSWVSPITSPRDTRTNHATDPSPRGHPGASPHCGAHLAPAIFHHGHAHRRTVPSRVPLRCAAATAGGGNTTTRQGSAPVRTPVLRCRRQHCAGACIPGAWPAWAHSRPSFRRRRAHHRTAGMGAPRAPLHRWHPATLRRRTHSLGGTPWGANSRDPVRSRPASAPAGLARPGHAAVAHSIPPQAHWGPVNSTPSPWTVPSRR